MKKEKAIAILKGLIDRGSGYAHRYLTDPYTISDMHPEIRAFQIEALETIEKISGRRSNIHQEFAHSMGVDYIRTSVELLKSLHRMVENDLIESIKTLVSREFFNNVADAAEDALQKKYKNVAALLVGTALEQRIHALCVKIGIPVHEANSTKYLATGDLNAELTKRDVYDKNTQKEVTAWLGVRNSAAHAREGEYSNDQVESMILGIRRFLDAYPE